jgi:hypothetical protein
MISSLYRPLKFAIAALALALLSACATTWLTEKEKYLTDEIRGFYKTEDATSLAIIGKQYHYVFPLDPDLSSALTGEKRNRLSAEFGTFHLGKDSTITGNYKLSVSLDLLSPSERTDLTLAGFSQKGDLLVLSKMLSGRAYVATKGSVPSDFKQPYTVSIAQDVSKPAAVKYALSPIAVAVDGTLLLGGLVLIHVGCIVKDIFSDRCFP